jgi:hypothetical protein
MLLDVDFSALKNSTLNQTLQYAASRFTSADKSNQFDKKNAATPQSRDKMRSLGLMILFDQIVAVGNEVEISTSLGKG